MGPEARDEYYRTDLAEGSEKYDLRNWGGDAPPSKDAEGMSSVLPHLVPQLSRLSCSAYLNVPTKGAGEEKKVGNDLKARFQETARHYRSRALDNLRGFSVVGMVPVHFMEFYGNSEAAKTWLYFVLSAGFGNLGAVVFLLVAGMSRAASDSRKAASAAGSRQPPRAFQNVLRRFWRLFWAEQVTLVVAFGPAKLFNFDILTLHGTAAVVLQIARDWPSWSILCAGAAVALAAPALRSTVDFAATWGDTLQEVTFTSTVSPGILFNFEGMHSVDWNWMALLQDYLISGRFPVFPWLSFPLFGYVLGRRLASQKLHGELVPMALVGALLVALGVGGALHSRSVPGTSVVTSYVSPLSFFPNSSTMVLVQLGSLLVILAAVVYTYEVRPPLPLLQGAAPLQWLYVRSGRHALRIFCWHYVLIGWPLALRYTWTGGEDYPIANWMGAEQSLAAGLAALIVFQVLITFWDLRAGTTCYKGPDRCREVVEKWWRDGEGKSGSADEHADV